MKTQKEIEQLAEQDFNDRQECGHYELADLKSIDYYYDGFTNGYTQCQKDMGDKKYTEEDLENAFNSGRGYGVPDNIKDFNSFINSLNKQD